MWIEGPCLIDDSKEISTDTTAWSELPRELSCDARQDEVRNKSSNVWKYTESNTNAKRCVLMFYRLSKSIWHCAAQSSIWTVRYNLLE